MKIQILGVCLIALIFSNQSIAGRRGHPFNPQNLVGNVCGLVTDKENGYPIRGAEVYLLDLNSDPQIGVEEIERQLLLSLNHFKPKRVTDEKGRFLINFVPTPYDWKTYELLVKANGYESKLIKELAVPSGAVDAPELSLSLKRGAEVTRVIEKDELSSILYYGFPGSQSQKPTQTAGDDTKKPNGLKKISTIGASIYATDETFDPSTNSSNGLIGTTTANGHVIDTLDHFCALPSANVLCSSDQDYSWNVTLYHGNGSQTSVPVWDRGPKNWHDNYWDPESQREIYQYLNQGGQPGLGAYVPETEAAHDNGYNKGYGEPGPHGPNGWYLEGISSGRSGIDLAEGTWRDLGLTGDDYVEVVYNWQNTSSVVNEDIKQTEDWFGSVTVEANGSITDIHITNKQEVDVITQCNFTINTGVRLIIDAGSTLTIEKGASENFQKSQVVVSQGAICNDYNGYITGIGNGCQPPPAPINVSATIVGSDIVLSWSEKPNSATEFFVYVNGSQVWGGTTTTYTIVGGANTTLPATFQVSASNGSCETRSPFLNAMVSPSVISQNPTNWNGLVYVKSNVIVNSGVLLDIGPGTNIVFQGGYSYGLRVNGRLEAQGPITFTSSSGNSPGSWGSIVLNGSGANSSTISYANIQNGTEVDVYSANNVTIQYCNITNNSGNGIYVSSSSNFAALHDTIKNTNINHGIYFSGGSGNNCYYNVISKTNHGQNGAGILYAGSSGTVGMNDIDWYNWGIAAIWGASPMAQINPGPKNNRVTNCLLGLNIYYQSYCDFDDGYRNSIYNNINCVYNAAVGYSYPSVASGLYAGFNWWGNYPPNSSLFYVSSACYGYFIYPLSSDPWYGYPLPSNKPIENGVEVTPSMAQNSSHSGPMGSIQTPVATPSVPTDPLLTGLILRGQNKFTEAKDFFLSYLNNHPDNQAAYVYLYSCANNETTPEIIQYFNNLPKQADISHKLLLAHLYLMQGDINSAKQINNAIIAANPNIPLAVRAKLNNLSIALHFEHDVSTASAILTQVKSQSSLSTPMEILTAEATFKFYVDPQTGKMPNINTDLGSNAANSALAINDGLNQNFPNPFNPTTSIAYRITQAGKVSLKVYDVLGREVAVLVNDEQGVGTYTQRFDASRLSSGIYFYRLIAPGVNETRKMLVAK